MWMESWSLSNLYWGDDVFYLAEIAPSQPSTHWKVERYVSVALLTLIPTGIIYPSAAVNWALAVVIPLHNHW